MKKNKSEQKPKISANEVLGKLVNYGSYIFVVFILFVLIYLSFIETLTLTPNWKTATLFSVASVFLSWFTWNMFYQNNYSKTMATDEAKAKNEEYSVHFRYYMATKDWTDADLQAAIDKYNDEFTQKWLNWVEKTTGVPIESKMVTVIDQETGEEKLVKVKGIKELPYRKFHYKLLMWRIKHHKYPKSGYKTSREILSLFSSEDSNFKERNLRADKKFFRARSAKKLLCSILILVVGASITIQFINGNWAEASLRLILGIGTLLSSIFFGAFNGMKGANLKLAIVEDVCYDLEKWANTKPIIAPYKEPISKEIDEQKNVNEPEKSMVVTSDIFSKLNIPKE